MKNKKIKCTIEEFAKLIFDVLKSDRDVNLGCAGFTGNGKSTFTTLLEKTYSKIAGMPWSFENMTWERSEMLKWIDGEKGSVVDSRTGLKKGQVPEYTAILPDELFHMFYKRNWHNSEQIDGIATFNMCRDRHLLVAGNVPNFWKLDSAFTERIRFYVYIPKRGKAWVFMQEENPFSSDPWNQQENLKLFRKHGNPYKSPNFVFEIDFPDWDEQEKIDYLKVRNTKRVIALQKEDTEKSTQKSNKDGLAFGALCSYLDINEIRDVNNTKFTPYRIEKIINKLRDHKTITKKVNDYRLWYSQSGST